MRTQHGFTPVVFILIIIIVGFTVIVGYLKLKTRQSPVDNIVTPTPEMSPTPPVVPTVVVTVTPAPVHSRSLSDNPDETKGSQIKFIYAIPKDGIDNQYDINGALKSSVEVFQDWFSKETSGRKFKVDKYQGSLDVAFIKLTKTDAEIASSNQYVRERLSEEIKAQGFNSSEKIYAVYYDGSSTFSCGGGAWPPEINDNVAAVYLKGTPPGSPPCSSNKFAKNIAEIGYWEFSMFHEIFHTLGAVATCAPHHTRSGHVSEDPSDFMYAGDQPWHPSKLDIGRDDYWGHNNPNCLDVSLSPFFTP